ncbi:MAG TPA: type II secretion system F family protein [Candidatus Udaeobacter sp.]|nr:type II secretion system F family protein [Candidatus Udaeobacter sp.]
MILVAAILIFLAVGLTVVGVTMERQAASVRALSERLKRFGGGARELPELGIERDRRYSYLPWLDHLLRSLNVGARLELLLYQAGMTMRAGVLVLLSATFLMGGYFIAFALFHRIMAGLFGMALVGPIPYLYVLYRKQVRMSAFSKEFPDSLDLLVSALRAGLAFSAAMQIVADESPEPVRGEFAITVEEQSLGIDLREALTNLSSRVDSIDLRFFVTAVLLQRDTGGNLADILENTAKLIRDRFRILGDIKTFTAQGRMTGVILSVLPVALALMMYLASPDWFSPMLTTHGGRVALMVAGSMQLIGALIIRKIVNIKV